MNQDDNPDVAQADAAAENMAGALRRAMEAGCYKPPVGVMVEVVSILDLPEPEACLVCGSFECRPADGVCRDAGERCECPEILALREEEPECSCYEIVGGAHQPGCAFHGRRT